LQHVCEVLVGDLQVVRRVVDVVDRQTGDQIAVLVDEAGPLGQVDLTGADLVEHAHLVGERQRVAANVDGGSIDP
jgi:hypothetical protein